MGIPKITAYPMPAAGQLPGNTVSWAVDPRRAVLLIHDMQRYFLSRYPAGQPPLADLVRNLSLLRERAVTLGVPVAYTAQPGDMSPQQRGLLADFWGSGMTAGPAHRQIEPALAPGPDDWLFTKWRYSAFHRTDLADRIRAAGRDQLLCCGVYAHVGVLATTMDALAQDIQAFLVADAVADFSAGHHRLTLRYAAQVSAAVTTTQATLHALASAGAPA